MRRNQRSDDDGSLPVDRFSNSHVNTEDVCRRFLVLFSLAHTILRSYCTMTGADKDKKPPRVPSLLDTPDPSSTNPPHTSPPRFELVGDTPEPHVNFTGSTSPADYVFNIDLPPSAHPPDVQAYLYCVGSAAPSTKGTEWKWGVEAGARLLRSVRDDGQG